MTPELPIDAALPELTRALRAAGRAVLQAPPGAGKTTRVPLAMLEAGLPAAGRIVMLEPRRLAARGAAARMAETLGEPVGETVGYRMRGETRVSKATRIEVVTEGILTRMLQSDPELGGVGALIFDEFHERSLNADLGLALSWEVREALRPDLMVLVMSATLDAGPVAEMLDAPVVTSEGRSHPVDLRWQERPVAKGQRFEAAMADLVAQAVGETDGGVLAFLPGEGEIRRVAAALEGRLPAGVAVQPLYGALPFSAQRAAVAPLETGRKLVLATAIAETALTIQDVRVVVDGGLARRARFDPGRGMTRLVTERVTRAEATQRTGRAGRVAPGLCYRLWTKGEDGGLQAFPPPEITTADLCGLALELAMWGVQGPEELSLLTPPPEKGLAEARALLVELGALDAAGHVTGHGRALAALPLHPRLAHMLAVAGPEAAPLAALLNDRDPLRGEGTDLTLRLKALRRAKGNPALERIATEAKRLRRLAGQPEGAARTPAEMAALAYPDRVGLRRPGDAPRWLLSGGTGAEMDAGDPLAGSRLIVATELTGGGREAKIRQAVALTEAELRGLYGDRIGWHDVCRWSKRHRRVEARQQERFGALVLDDRIWKNPPPEAFAAALLDAVRDLGLPWTDRARRLQSRIELLRGQGADLPDSSDAALMKTLEDWLLPALAGRRSLDGLDIADALLARLDWPQRQALDRLAPPDFETPLGRKIPIDYAGGTPQIEVRLQEMFGVTEHPVIGPDRLPLKVTLLSPARRPVQVTTDLPGFWATSYAEVRKDMRGQYPKHPWPEDPTQADPTLRAKRRG
ncbi:ATP-dependent helicase HrpB [Psychromarinibacter sp. C21-152]|uniref:ATP-dependent helicase HrpB n=1 Tax=Psychromarinibacter sediminicola TaxID=3033385 RepID=A0AAE3T9V8_9RHOB|nr:ATP-dependent helicase HrpB [Psychromarinibacter sediminicola]MDF0602228.1 ATP-dependent helicase HrpB [Psychromarinibacter sediminicola]